jgi:hypothetical protein
MTRRLSQKTLGFAPNGFRNAAIAAPMVGGMITSTIHLLILVPVFFVLMKERALRRGTLRPEPAAL